MKVLVVEEQKSAASSIEKKLSDHGCEVEVLRDGVEGYTEAIRQDYDVMVVSTKLPSLSGVGLITQLRRKGITKPALMITTPDDLESQLEVLRLGASDFLTKPFYTDELMARLRVAVERSSGESVSTLRAGDLSMDLINRKVMREGIELRLTTREFSLLELLMRKQGQALSRNQICRHVWKTHQGSETNLVDVYIQRVRKKVDYDFADQIIETVRGVGYRIGTPVT